MTDAAQAAHQLSIALEAIGSPAVVEGETVALPSLALRVRMAEVEVREGGAVVVYDVGALDSTDPGITVLAVGYGDTPERALADAAFQWTTGVFTVVRHWMTPAHHTCFVEDAHMLVRDEDSLEEFGWRIHLGPVLSRSMGAGENEGPMPAKPLDFFKVLFDDVHGRAAHRTLFWIEAFVVRHQDGRVDSTARLHNDDWPEGEEALAEWAGTWSIPARTMVTARQFLLFEPIPPSEVPDGQGLARELDAVAGRKSPWWKRLFGT